MNWKKPLREFTVGELGSYINDYFPLGSERVCKRWAVTPRMAKVLLGTDYPTGALHNKFFICVEPGLFLYTHDGVWQLINIRDNPEINSEILPPY